VTRVDFGTTLAPTWHQLFIKKGTIFQHISVGFTNLRSTTRPGRSFRLHSIHPKDRKQSISIWLSTILTHDRKPDITDFHSSFKIPPKYP
jgi:hypothetical protein